MWRPHASDVCLRSRSRLPSKSCMTACRSASGSAWTAIAPSLPSPARAWPSICRRRRHGSSTAAAGRDATPSSWRGRATKSPCSTYRPATWRWRKPRLTRPASPWRRWCRGRPPTYRASTMPASTPCCLMGPLYHLLEEQERFSAVAEAKRVVRPGGLVFAAFITRYAAHRWAAANEPTWIVDDPEAAQTLLDTGRLPPRPHRPGGFIGYFAHPDEVVPLIRRAGLEVRAVLGVDALVSQIEEGVNRLSGTAWERWVDLSTRVASDPALFGAAEHLLVLARQAAVARSAASSGSRAERGRNSLQGRRQHVSGPAWLAVDPRRHRRRDRCSQRLPHSSPLA